MAGRLDGKVAYVTGAGSGIGAATARGMAREGAALAVVDIDADAARTVADGIADDGGRAVAIEMDVRDADAIEASYDTTVQAFGRLDVLHLNAAGARPDDGDIVSTSLETWQWTFETNVGSLVTGLRLGIPHLLETGGGRIVLTSSGAAQIGDFQRVAYGSLKSVVDALARYVATTHGKQGITANSILPGFVMTPGAAAGFPAQLSEVVKRHQTVDRYTLPEDVAELAVFLASDAAQAITGQSIPIDGGVSIQSPAAPTTNEIVAALMREQQG